METQTQTSPVSGITTEVAPNGQAHIPGTQVVTLTPPAPGIDKFAVIKRFEETFKLEGEVVGHSIKRSVSKKGAIRVALKPAKEVGKDLNIKGDALAKHMRELGIGLKGEMQVGFNRIASNPAWVGLAVTQNAKGNVVTFQLKRVEPLAISEVARELTNEEMAAQLGIPVEMVAQMKAMKAQKDAEEAELKRMEAEEQAAQQAANAAQPAEEVPATAEVTAQE